MTLAQILRLCSIATLLSVLAVVTAHGYVQEVDIGSTVYTGYLPYTDPYYVPPPERIIRKIYGNGETFALVSCVFSCCYLGPVTDITLIEYAFPFSNGVPAL